MLILPDESNLHLFQVRYFRLILNTLLKGFFLPPHSLWLGWHLYCHNISCMVWSFVGVSMALTVELCPSSRLHITMAGSIHIESSCHSCMCSGRLTLFSSNICQHLGGTGTFSHTLLDVSINFSFVQFTSSYPHSEWPWHCLGNMVGFYSISDSLNYGSWIISPHQDIIGGWAD